MDGYDIDLMAVQGNENWNVDVDEEEIKYWNDLLEFFGMN